MKKVLLSLLAVFIVAVIVLTFSLNSLVKNKIIKIAEGVVGSKVTIGTVNVSPFAGTIKLNNFAVKNPEGFKHENIFELGEVLVTIDSTKKVNGYWNFNIPQIIVTNPKINNEVNLSGNNIAVLKSKLAESIEEEKFDSAKFAPANPEVFAKKPKVLVSIQSFEVVNTDVELTQSIVGETSSKIIVPKVKITNIGMYDEPLLIDMVFRNILEKFLNSIVRESAKSAVEGQLDGVIGGAIQNSLQQLGIDKTDAVVPAETNPSEAVSPEKAAE